MEQLFSGGALAFLFSFPAYADCPDHNFWYDPTQISSVQLESGYTFSIDGYLATLRLGEQIVSQIGVHQPDAGPPSHLIALSQERFAVLGDRFDYIIDLAEQDGEWVIGSSQAIPPRYPVLCEFWESIWNICPTSRAGYSKTFDGVVSSGWSANGEYGSILYRGSNEPVEIALPGGVSLGYFGEDRQGIALLGTDSGEYILFDGTEYEVCG